MPGKFVLLIFTYILSSLCFGHVSDWKSNYNQENKMPTQDSKILKIIQVFNFSMLIVID